MKNYEEFNVEIIPSTFSIGEDSRICIKGLPDPAYRIGWTISLVDDDFTTFAMASSGIVIETSEGKCIECQQFGQLQSGLYQLTKIDLRDENDTIVRMFEPPEYGICLFEIYDPQSGVPPNIDLLIKFDEIIRCREAEFGRGFGSGESRYKAFVFAKDILITQRIRLGHYELINFDGLSCLDEIHLIQKFLASIGQPSLGNTDEILDRAERGQPTLIVHFPNVRSDSVENAGELVEKEADLIIALLSMQRGGAGEVFGSLIYDVSQQKPYYRIYTPQYGGNLLGGWLSGEDPRTIVGRMESLHRSQTSVLYVNLFREALREPNPEFQYFRYWNILETIARGKNYPGQPKLDWQGIVIKNRKGEDRFIQDKAEEVVYELIRQVLSSNFSEQSFASGLSQGSLSEQISIWYKRRNCVVHGAECLCRDPNLSLGNRPKYANCKRARDETSSQAYDGYLSALGELTKIVISAELT